MDVRFNAGGQIREDASTNNTVDTLSDDNGKEAMQPYTIAPIVWLFVLLIGGYIGLRYIMED